MDDRRLFLKVEASEHLEWMQEQMGLGRLPALDEETSVLLAVKAICRVDGIAPVYGNFAPGAKEYLVRACIVLQCWYRQGTLPENSL